MHITGAEQVHPQKGNNTLLSACYMMQAAASRGCTPAPLHKLISSSELIQSQASTSTFTSTGTRQSCAQVCDTTAEIALDLVPKQAWPELLPFLFQCTQNSDPRMVEAGLLIFAQLAGSVMDALTPYIATLHGVLMHCLVQPSPPPTEERTAVVYSADGVLAAAVQQPKLGACGSACGLGHGGR